MCSKVRLASLIYVTALRQYGKKTLLIFEIRALFETTAFFFCLFFYQENSVAEEGGVAQVPLTIECVLLL